MDNNNVGTYDTVTTDPRRVTLAQESVAQINDLLRTVLEKEDVLALEPPALAMLSRCYALGEAASLALEGPDVEGGDIGDLERLVKHGL